MTTDAKQDAAQAGLNTGEFDPNKELPVSTLALTESDAMNKLAFSALAPDWVKEQVRNDGMSEEERRELERQEQEREELFRLRLEAQWRETASKYDEIISEIDAARAKLERANADLDGCALRKSDGTKVFRRGDKLVTINEATGEETEVTDPEELAKLKRQEEALQAQGKQTADADQKQKIIDQRRKLDEARAQAVAGGNNASAQAAGGPRGTPQEDKARADAGSAAAGDLGSRVGQLTKEVDTTVAAVEKVHGSPIDSRKIANVDADLAELDSSPRNLGRNGSAASQIDALPSPDKGKAVSAFTASASPTPSAPQPAATPAPDPNLNRNVGVANGGPS